MRKLLLVVALVVLAVPATAPAKGSGAAQERRQGVQGAARPDGRRHVPHRVRQQAARARSAAVSPRSGRQGRPPASAPARHAGPRACAGQAMKRCVRSKLAAEPASRAGRLRGRGQGVQGRPGRGPRGLRRRVRRRPERSSKCVAHEVSDDDEGTEVDEPGRGRRRRGLEPGSDEPRTRRATSPSRALASREHPAVAPRIPAREVRVRLAAAAASPARGGTGCAGSRCGRSRCAMRIP